MKRVAVLLEGQANPKSAKTAIGVIRFGDYEICGIIDSHNTGRVTQEVLGCGGQIPFYACLNDLLREAGMIDEVIIGCSYVGGHLPTALRPAIIEGIKRGITIVNGLHDLLQEDAEFVTLAGRYGAHLIDVRNSANQEYHSRYNPHRPGTYTVLTVGSDCAVGKMTTSIVLHREVLKHNMDSVFAATGQTGIMIAGHGVPVDRTLSDFTIGLVGQYVAGLSQTHDWIFVEGQGGIMRGNISLGILQGSDPDALILCHDVSRKTIKFYDMWQVAPMERLIQVYNEVGTWVRDINPAKVVGISLNTSSLPEEDALRQIREVENRLGLPVTDPVRFGVANLFEALQTHAGTQQPHEGAIV